MRAYLPLSHDELAAFLNNGSKELESILAPTPFYVGESKDLDEEEIEFTLSMVAAEDAQEMKSAGTGAACVLAFEIPQSLISESHEMSVSLSGALTWSDLQCLFEVSADGQELTWFATQEISQNLSTWLKQA